MVQHLSTAFFLSMFEQNFLRGTICVDGVPLQKVRRRANHILLGRRLLNPPRKLEKEQSTKFTMIYTFSSLRKSCATPCFYNNIFASPPTTFSLTLPLQLLRKVLTIKQWMQSVNRTKNPNSIRLFGFGLKYISQSNAMFLFNFDDFEIFY